MQMSCIVQLVQFLFLVVHPQASPNFNRICIVQLPAVSSRLRGVLRWPAARLHQLKAN